MKKRFFAALVCLCLLVGLIPNVGTTAFAADTTDYAIGDTVEFAGHNWYIIGTESEGVTAPEGCYTLLIASPDDFGSTVFREGADGTNESDNYYSGSKLQTYMVQIANNFSQENRNNIVPRSLTAANDEIAGPDVNNQYVWALSKSEANNVYANIYYPSSYRYWARTGEYNDNLSPGNSNKYCVWDVRTWAGSDAFLPEMCLPTENRYAFPALYVRASALPEPPTTGDYILGKDAISNAYVGGDLEYSRGADAGLTISDSQKADVRVKTTLMRQSGSFLSFILYGGNTTTGENQVLACVLTDQNRTVKYYGKLADCSSSPGTINVTVPMAGVADGTYTLSIFSHNTKTNEISQPSPTMTVSVSGRVGTVSNYKGDFELVIEVDPPKFTEHPQTQIVSEGGSVTFSAEAYDSGAGVTYSWYAQDKSSGSDGTWYQILSFPEGGGVYTPINSENFTINNVSGTWGENNLGLDVNTTPTFQPADARFRCAATSAGVTTYSEVAELLVGGSGGQDGENGVTPQLRINDETMEWEVSYDEGKTWTSLGVSSVGKDGENGKQVELRVNGDYIQWKYDTDADDQWQNLIALSDLKGADGTDGKDGVTPQLRINGETMMWEVSYDNGTTWTSLGVSAVGKDGQDGHDGQDGDTPYIGENGNWWIGNVDTGVKASGTDGSNGSDGSDGSDGKDGKDGLTPYIGSNGNWWIGTTDTGVKAAGTDGKDGANGKDGVGIADITLNGNGELVVTLTDGTVKNLGKISVTGSGGSDGADGATGADGSDGSDGKDGVGIADIKLNENGELVVTLTDGTEKNLGKVQGEDGVGISGVSLNENGELIVTLTDGTELNAGAVPTAASEDSGLKTLVYVSVGTAGVSLAGLIGLLAFLLTKRKSLIGK